MHYLDVRKKRSQNEFEQDIDRELERNRRNLGINLLSREGNSRDRTSNLIYFYNHQEICYENISVGSKFPENKLSFLWALRTAYFTADTNIMLEIV